MKTNWLLTGALGALTLGLAVSAVAAPAAAPTPPPPPGATAPGQPGPDRMGPRRMDRMGPNRMGRGAMRVTPEERAKRRAEQFARIDANKDGRVTEPEFRAYLEARKREREHQAFLRFSGDQDAVTLDQLNARALTRERAMERRGGGRGGWR